MRPCPAALQEAHLPQLLEADADIVPCPTEQGIYFVAQLAHQVVPPRLAVRLHVTDPTGNPLYLLDCLAKRMAVKRLPCSVNIPTAKLSRLVVAIRTLTLNSYFLCALPFEMHSTSGTCGLYGLFLSCFSCINKRPAKASSGRKMLLNSKRSSIFR